ncbi:phage tail protein [Pseudomonas mucidolens]|uniref:Phage tail-collar fibre protein n=1 Tax=Pseudomonas mucidolens TaxID=46679 RepID=A0A1H2M4C6_9PSED|nr:phage tail protein [Pseudomonas mucidolens]SDU87964.1 Phage tail-collar fibre protein [Pseudomonas mucidolens]SQH34580.1 putative tail fiber protein [Pseudomonas mucidolens]
MTDENSQFFAILTAVGRAKQANADALGVAWTFAQMGVGDANDTDPIPSEQQTQLINERRRAPLNQLRVDPANANVIIAEQVIPESVGGWWIREVGLYDADGDLVAVANCAPSFKPLLSQGSGRTQVVRMNLIVSNTANVELKIDPSIVLATRQYVDSKILEELYKLDTKQSVRVATTANIALAGLLNIDGVTLLAGDRVLVKNQTAAKDNGIYIAASGAWKRAPDADSNLEVTSALLLSVEQGTTQADTRWQLVTDGAIVLGTTALTFQNVKQGYAPIDSPAFKGTPTVPTLEPTDVSTRAANSATVRAIMELFGIGASASKNPLITDFSADILPGIYRAFASGNAAASIGGPPDTGDTSMSVIAGGGFTNPGYKTFIAVINSSGVTRLFVGSKILVGAQPVWTEITQTLHLPFRGTTSYKSAGVFTWEVPGGVKKAWVTVIGGGGGGGRAGFAENGSGGGGGGGFAQELVDLTGITSVTVTVGAGGAGGATDGATGGAGAASSFGSYLSATGGDGAQGGAPYTLNNGPGAGGRGFGGDINTSLGPGQVSYGTVGGCGGGPGGRCTQGPYPGNGGIGPGGGGSGAVFGNNGGPGAAGSVIIQW